MSVSAHNEVGSGEEANASTAMPIAPDALQELQVAVVEETRALIAFTFGNDGNNEIKHAILSVTSIDGGDNLADIMIEPTQTSQVIEGLDKGASYVVTASVSNFVFTSEESSVGFRTLSEPGVITDFFAREIGSDTVTLAWTAPADDGRSEIISFKVHMWELVGTDDQYHGYQETSEPEVTITDLQPASEWKFTV